MIPFNSILTLLCNFQTILQFGNAHWKCYSQCNKTEVSLGNNLKTLKYRKKQMESTVQDKEHEFINRQLEYLAKSIKWWLKGAHIWWW